MKESNLNEYDFISGNAFRNKADLVIDFKFKDETPYNIDSAKTLQNNIRISTARASTDEQSIVFVNTSILKHYHGILFKIEEYIADKRLILITHHSDINIIDDALSKKHIEPG